MDCRICFSKFNKYLRKPIVLLPCCHTFCLNCIVTLKTKSNEKLNCPQCRKLINVFKTNYAVLDIIDSNPQNLMEQISRSESVTSDTKEKYFSPNHDHYFETVEPANKWECCGNKMLGNCRYFTDWPCLDNSLDKLDKTTTYYECKLCSDFILCQSCLEAPKKSPNDHYYSKNHPHRLILSSLDDGWACNGSIVFNECKSNLNDYNLSKGMKRYTCTECDDFDFCQKCLEYDGPNENKKLKQDINKP